MKKIYMFLICLTTLFVIGCSGENKDNVDSVTSISLGDWLSDKSITELCKVTNIPSKSKIIYSNGYTKGKAEKTNPNILTSEKKRSIGEFGDKEIIFESIEYKLGSGDLDTVSFSVSDSWSKVKKDKAFKKYSDIVVYTVSDSGMLEIYMCLDKKEDKTLGINAKFKDSNINARPKVKMLLNNIDIIEENRKEFKTVSNSKDISQEDSVNVTNENTKNFKVSE